MLMRKQIHLWSMIFIAFFVLFVYGAENANSQIATAPPLTWKTVTIDNTKPTVYLCAEPPDVATLKRDDELWLRFNNNTIWPLMLNAEKVDGESKILKLSDGTNVGALGNGSTVKLLYSLKYSKTGASVPFQSTDWGDMLETSWLPSQSYARFRVSRTLVMNKILSSQYKYEWEVQKGIVPESNGAVHTVTINFDRLKNISKFECKP